MASVNEPIMLSALEHYAYCPRQCGLIHLEQVFDENIYTLRGEHVHRQVDLPGSEMHYQGRIERAMPLWSQRLGLVGKADLVEFWEDGTVYPVEYKSGSKRSALPEKIQLCAQAFCLEEMLDTSVSKGALFWFGSRQRVEVVFDDKLRTQTLETIEQTRQMLAKRVLAPPVNAARCHHCSLIDACMPEIRRTQPPYSTLFEVDDETTA